MRVPSVTDMDTPELDCVFWKISKTSFSRFHLEMQTQKENHIPKKQAIYISWQNTAVLEDNWVILGTHTPCGKTHFWSLISAFD